MNNASLLSKKGIAPENVEIGDELAGIGYGGHAVLFDLSFYALCMLSICLLTLLTLFFAVGSFPAFYNLWVTPLLLILAFFAHWGYFIFFETLYHGKLRVKRMRKIVVHTRRRALPLDKRLQAASFLLKQFIQKYGEQIPVSDEALPEEILESLVSPKLNGY